MAAWLAHEVELTVAEVVSEGRRLIGTGASSPVLAPPIAQEELAACLDKLTGLAKQAWEDSTKAEAVVQRLCRPAVMAPWVSFLRSLACDELLQRIQARPLNAKVIGQHPVLCRVMLLLFPDFCKPDVVSMELAEATSALFYQEGGLSFVVFEVEIFREEVRLQKLVDVAVAAGLAAGHRESYVSMEAPVLIWAVLCHAFTRPDLALLVGHELIQQASAVYLWSRPDSPLIKVLRLWWLELPKYEPRSPAEPLPIASDWPDGHPHTPELLLALLRAIAKASNWQPSDTEPEEPWPLQSCDFQPAMQSGRAKVLAGSMQCLAELLLHKPSMMEVMLETDLEVPVDTIHRPTLELVTQAGGPRLMDALLCFAFRDLQRGADPRWRQHAAETVRFLAFLCKEMPEWLALLASLRKVLHILGNGRAQPAWREDPAVVQNTVRLFSCLLEHLQAASKQGAEQWAHGGGRDEMLRAGDGAWPGDDLPRLNSSSRACTRAWKWPPGNATTLRQEAPPQEPKRRAADLAEKL
ncbi:hypothetical protein WJX72_000816 [[Myrmecia] bisecta]|uniref:Uncharacterized protein n=1 Tax=[Myrmecia] bisecta TaxID=41462 RepID=A0AAW1P9G1_9CHLO